MKGIGNCRFLFLLFSCTNLYKNLCRTCIFLYLLVYQQVIEWNYFIDKEYVVPLHQQFEIASDL